MKKITEDFLEDVIKRNVSTHMVKSSKTGAMIERERVDVRAIVKEVMDALRAKRKTSIKKKAPIKKKASTKKKGR